MNKRGFQYIFFDLDNTLFDYSIAEKRAIETTMRHLGVVPDSDCLERYSAINLAQWKQLEKGLVERDVLKVRRFQIFFRELSLDYPAEEAAAYYENRLACGHYFMEGALTVLSRLAPKKKLYLITNGSTSIQYSRLESSGIIPCFQKIFISEEIGFHKPDLRYFSYCFSQIPDFCREEAILVGDSLTSDIQGGINAGIQTVWFNPRKENNSSGIKPDYEIRKLTELLEILAS